MKTGTATGKIILSGEYAVVFGYPGIAVPCSCLGHTTGAVTATWAPHPALSRGEREKITVTHHGIENEEYLETIIQKGAEIVGARHALPLQGPLTIENTIPIGRGMGSSTALVIAICRCLLEKQHSPLSCRSGRGAGGEGKNEEPKEIAAAIEDAVNPCHSGLDFAVIWEGKPVKFTKADGPTPVDLNLSFLKKAILIDTGKPNETTPEMVAWIKDSSLSPRERVRVRVRGALQTIGHCTERLLKGEDIKEIFKAHHRAQITLGVVPKPVQTLIAEIEKAGGAAKVVGAGGQTGGGGMVLAIHQNHSLLEKIAREHGFPVAKLDSPLTTGLMGSRFAAWQSGQHRR